MQTTSILLYTCDWQGVCERFDERLTRVCRDEMILSVIGHVLAAAWLLYDFYNSQRPVTRTFNTTLHESLVCAKEAQDDD